MKRHPLTVWELPKLLAPVHTFRMKRKKQAVERPHYAAILAYIYRNRFALTSQVQRRFPDRLRSGRTARRHLEEMEALGYLATAPTRAVGPLWPKVFFVTGRGVRILRQSLAVRGVAGTPMVPDRAGRTRSTGYGVEHVLHDVWVTEFLLAVWLTIRGRPDLGLLTVERRSLKRHSAFHVDVAGRESRLEPDALFLFRQTTGGMACCLLEMDLGTMNPKQLREKCRRYAAWAATDHAKEYLMSLYRTYGAVDPKPSFRIVFVIDDRSDPTRRMHDILTAAAEVSSTFLNRCWLTTVASIRQHHADPLPLEAGIWRRGKDWRLPPEGNRASRTDPAEFDALPAHPIFPDIEKSNKTP